MERKCAVSGCERPWYQREWCQAHYMRWYRNGDPEGGRGRLRVIGTPSERFPREYVVDPDGCWLWQGEISHNGYGRFRISKGKRIQAHRWSYLTFIGPIPDGWHVDHVCKVRRCVNPDHLEAVTAWENNARSKSPSAKHLLQTHCIRGHDFSDPAILYITPDGRRQCRPCGAMRTQKSYLAKRDS